MRFFDPHIHLTSRTTDDLEAMAAHGVRAVIEPAFWIGQPRTTIGSFVDYFSSLIGWERFRASQFGIQHYCAIGLNSKEANNEALAEEVLELLNKVNQDLRSTIVIVTHDPAIAISVGRAVAIKDGKTSTETTREVSFERRLGGEASEMEEFVLIDSAGSVQIPREMLEELNIGRRARVNMKDGRVTLESSE